MSKSNFAIVASAMLHKIHLEALLALAMTLLHCQVRHVVAAFEPRLRSQRKSLMLLPKVKNKNTF